MSMPRGNFSFLPPPSHDAEIERVLNALAAGGADPDALESQVIDLKEEVGRRDGSRILAGEPRSDAVAKQLAAAAACFANTRGGGVIIVGVDDATGELIGAESDIDWLRTRLYQLTDSKVNADIREVEISGARLLVITVPQAVEPVPYERRFQHRRGANCVPVTSTELLAGIFADVAADPSHRESMLTLSDLTDTAVASLRRRVAAVDRHKASLDLRGLLSRLGLVYRDTESLNLAGEVLLGQRSSPALDYTHRPVPGATSDVRVYQSGVSLLEELDLVESAYKRHNPFRSARRLVARSRRRRCRCSVADLARRQSGDGISYRRVMCAAAAADSQRRRAGAAPRRDIPDLGRATLARTDTDPAEHTPCVVSLPSRASGTWCPKSAPRGCEGVGSRARPHLFGRVRSDGPR